MVKHDFFLQKMDDFHPIVLESSSSAYATFGGGKPLIEKLQKM